METLSDQSPFSKQSRQDDGGRYGGGNLVLWAAVIAVLVGLNFASWSFCMWVFGQPEHPMNYRLLTRLDRLDPIHGFTPVTAPRGKFLSAKDLYAQVYPFGPEELRAYNGILKRHYLKNYLERDDVTFLSGEFAVVSSRPLKEGDVYSKGYVLRARSTTFPDALLDLALPATAVPEKFELEPGQVIRVEESSTCAAVLNIDRDDDGTMVFTVVPLVEREYEFGESAAIAVEAAPQIHLDPELWPISRETEEIEAKPVSHSAEATEAAEEKVPGSAPDGGKP